ncbi:hypothetical protein Fcan01_25098 [Folsomia candida]|uniref:Uncharacterized protein n=1 Tax=Folsomia candida TaxID=158441 RepID=A0A226D6T8_FOLCA|nr:hypothetical protein Fcan01_25098 [Folsomia candida]
MKSTFSESLTPDFSQMKILLPNFKQYFNLAFFSTSYAQGFKFFFAECPLFMKVLPFNFDRKEDRLTTLKGKEVDKAVFWASYALIVVYTGFFLWRILGSPGYENVAMTSLSGDEGEHQTIIFLATLTFCFFLYDTTLLLPGETAAVSAMITETFEIEADLIRRTGGSPTHVETIVRIVLGVVFSSRTNLPLIMAVLSIVMPQFGLASLFPALHFETSYVSTLVKIGIFLVEGWFWWGGCCAVILTNIIGYMVPIMVLKAVLGREIREKISNLRGLKIKYQRYRGLQIFLNVFNSCWESPFILFLLLGWTIVIIHSLFVLIHYHDKIGILTLLVFASLAIDGIIVIGLLHIFAAPYKMSREVVREWGQMAGNKKIWRSCAPLKVKIGTVNFFDKFTSLFVLEFCVTGVVNLLLGFQ